MKANEIVATGNYTTQVEIISRDEVGLLSESFNNMVDKIVSNKKSYWITAEHWKTSFVNEPHNWRQKKPNRITYF